MSIKLIINRFSIEKGPVFSNILFYGWQGQNRALNPSTSAFLPHCGLYIHFAPSFAIYPLIYFYIRSQKVQCKKSKLRFKEKAPYRIGQEMKLSCSLVWFILTASVAVAKTHTLNYTASWVKANPDGLHEKKMIGFNGEWPLPDIHVEKGDRVQVYLTNGFDDGTATSLHFHGLFQNTSLGNQIQMDGPSMVTQCPIVPGQTYLYNFTVPEQVGTFWYHAHMGAQYGDGMRGAFIIHDPEEPFQYDHEKIIILADHYHENYEVVTEEFLSRYNPTGAEPIPQNILFNNTMNVTLDFTPGETYLFRFLNVGLFVSQYIILEDHEMTVVEVDGIYVKPNVTDSIYLSAGQRMSVLIKAKDKMPTRNYAMMQLMDETMLDAIPPELQLNQTIQMTYGHALPQAASLNIEDCDLDRATNDFYLEPLIERDLLSHYDHQIVMDVRMINLVIGVNVPSSIIHFMLTPQDPHFNPHCDLRKARLRF